MEAKRERDLCCLKTLTSLLMSSGLPYRDITLDNLQEKMKIVFTLTKDDLKRNRVFDEGNKSAVQEEVKYKNKIQERLAKKKHGFTPVQFIDLEEVAKSGKKGTTSTGGSSSFKKGFTVVSSNHVKSDQSGSIGRSKTPVAYEYSGKVNSL